MKNTITATITIALFGTALFVVEQNRQRHLSVRPEINVNPVAKIELTHAVRSPGRVEGLTEVVDLRARISEQIQQIHVAQGQWVEAGEVLVSLDSSQLMSLRDLALAKLTEAEARKDRIENGFRDSEIETARHEAAAANARLEGAEKAYQRALILLRQSAASQQNVDDLFAEWNAGQASAAAAVSRLETISAPPRADELLAATAAVSAARAELEFSNTELRRAEIIAPAAGRILDIEGEVGELTGPDSEQPVIVMSDTSKLRCVAEVDEYDALKVTLGLSCEITSDGTEGVLARGTVAEIEPQMRPKQMFGQWAGERSDVYSRRVWIDLTESIDLPVGLPVDVYIEVKIPAES
ncbi:MAG: efflux RND transporter periplasmic adaptor subunit [Rubripirellula sp.]|nr:efflux RND transporter periplasmic adaptor subunit [Rubripirellula sp.]